MKNCKKVGEGQGRIRRFFSWLFGPKEVDGVIFDEHGDPHVDPQSCPPIPSCKPPKEDIDICGTFANPQESKIGIDIKKLPEVTVELEQKYKEETLRTISNIEFAGIPVICSLCVDRITILIPQNLYEELRAKGKTLEN